MNKRIDRFLLGLLWLLAMTLGANFWFNTRFGFNLLSSAHWQYLGQMQASGAKIDTLFYISLITAVFFMIFGLYFIIRPKLRKISFGQVIVPIKNNDSVVQEVPEKIPVETKNNTSLVRPPRLSIPVQNHYVQKHNLQTTNTPLPASNAFETRIPSIDSKESDNFDTFKLIFENAGYLVKKPLKIGNINIPLLAIGPDESLWIGGENILSDKIENAVEKLSSIFNETLEDIQINLNAFIINPLDSDFSGGENIKKFDSLDNLRDYMNEHKSRQITDNEKEDFEAYSEYIDTVVGYFNKL